VEVDDYLHQGNECAPDAEAYTAPQANRPQRRTPSRRPSSAHPRIMRDLPALPVADSRGPPAMPKRPQSVALERMPKAASPRPLHPGTECVGLDSTAAMSQNRGHFIAPMSSHKPSALQALGGGPADWRHWVQAAAAICPQSAELAPPRNPHSYAVPEKFKLWAPAMQRAPPRARAAAIVALANGTTGGRPASAASVRSAAAPSRQGTRPARRKRRAKVRRRVDKGGSAGGAHDCERNQPATETRLRANEEAFQQLQRWQSGQQEHFSKLLGCCQTRMSHAWPTHGH